MKQWVEVRMCGYLYEVPLILEEFYDDIEDRLGDSSYSMDMKIVNKVEEDDATEANYVLVFTIRMED